MSIPKRVVGFRSNAFLFDIISDFAQKVAAMCRRLPVGKMRLFTVRSVAVCTIALSLLRLVEYGSLKNFIASNTNATSVSMYSSIFMPYLGKIPSRNLLTENVNL